MTGCHKGGALNPPRRTGADQSGLIIAHLPQCCRLPEVVDTSGEPFISRRGISPLKTTHLSPAACVPTAIFAEYLMSLSENYSHYSLLSV